MNTPAERGINDASSSRLKRQVRIWLVGARPRTLTMAAVPVVVGAALAWSGGAGVDGLVFAATLLCAVLIQVGTNLFNDAADGERGADGPDRLGPLRLTGSGLATAARVRRAAIVSFSLALLAGVYLVAAGGAAILGIGIASLVAGYAYSSGPWPLSYGPWAELYVIAFFGVIAVTGSYFLQAGVLPTVAIVLVGIAVGCPAAAVLLVNNVRDRDADLAAGRRTLAGRLGAGASRWLYVFLMLAPYALLAAALGLRDLGVAWLSLPLALAVALRFDSAADGHAMNAQLGRTALSQTVLGVLLAVQLLVPWN
ncbi:MAG: 1,4-dihydroxy-2-naphthoate octaprenyltransferase [Pseudomonadota bacterium]